MYSGSSFVDLSRCYLVTEFKIMRMNDDGEAVNITAADNVSTIQLLGSTFIRNLKVAPPYWHKHQSVLGDRKRPSDVQRKQPSSLQMLLGHR